MRLLKVHESYTQRGGEDQSIEVDTALLQSHGHVVERWSVSNRDLEKWGILRKTALLWRTTWSTASRREMRRLIERHRPDVVHFHNTLPIISPSAIRAAHDAGVPVVMTLHNYRLMCPVATYLRQGRICEDCRTHSLARSVVHGCYRGSRAQTTAVAIMLASHRSLGTWNRCIDAFVAVSEFVRQKAIEGGLPADRVHARSNPVAAAEPMPGPPMSTALFVGRLSEEKGIACLLEASALMPEISLVLVGAGPLEPKVREVASRPGSRIEPLGQLLHDEAMARIRRARVLVFPSIWYEPYGNSIVEAFACGVPVVASRLGAMAEIVTDGHDGFLFTPGDARELADRVRRLMTDDALRERMGRAARATYEARYSTDRCYEKLMDIYRLAIESARARRTAA